MEPSRRRSLQNSTWLTAEASLMRESVTVTMNNVFSTAKPMELRIAHLYAHFLNIYGDRGNIICLSQRARWRGIDVVIKPVGLAEHIDPDYFDLYFIGGGQDKQQ